MTNSTKARIAGFVMLLGAVGFYFALWQMVHGLWEVYR